MNSIFSMTTQLDLNDKTANHIFLQIFSALFREIKQHVLFLINSTF